MARRFRTLALVLLALVAAPVAASAHYVDLNQALHSKNTLTVGVALTGQSVGRIAPVERVRRAVHECQAVQSQGQHLEPVPEPVLCTAHGVYGAPHYQQRQYPQPRRAK